MQGNNKLDTFNQIFDLCIVGAGPAGIILALEYGKRNPAHKVILVEYGDSTTGERNSLDDSIQINNLINHHDPYHCTNKGFGGTSATWGGRCVMYDAIDFLDRPILNGGCTWVGDVLHSIQDYLPRAAAYFECGAADFNLRKMSEYTYKSIAEGFTEGTVLDSIVERWSMPTRFGKRYRSEISQLENLTVVEGLEARNFAVPDESGRVATLTLRQLYTKKELTVQSRKFVISAGAQESTRLLLRSSSLFKYLEAIPPALGRYYQSHLSGKIATVKFYGNPKKTDFGFISDQEGVYLRRRFQFSTEYLQKNNLLNTAIWLDNPLYFNPAHKSGAMSFMYLAMITPVLGEKLAPPAIAQSITKGKSVGIPQHILNIIKGLPKSLFTPATIFYKRYLIKRKLPGVFLYSPTNEYALHFHSEQIPDYSNQMKLNEDGETLSIEYRLMDDDIKSVIELHETLDNWLRKNNCGELRYWFPKDQLFHAIKNMSKDGIHQSGTTRIGKSPNIGVVDENLKVFGTENVFVCSSSVFPTSSQANPTFFLGAYAVRLADHLTKLQ